MASAVVLLFIALGCCLVQMSNGEGKIDIKFISYRNNCGDCDPKFTFCVDRPSSSYSLQSDECYYRLVGESDHYHDTGYIEFGDSIKGIGNPWRITFDTLREKQIMLVARTRDKDSDIFFWDSDDHMATWGATYTETVYPTETEAKYARRTMKKEDHELIFDIKIFCINNYYDWNCGVQCLPPKDSDHYTCDTSNGKKICNKGWTGNNCDEDINECEQNICERGDCENLEGSFNCTCPQHYSGPTCSIMDDPCEFEPCLNNGTCEASSTEYSFACSCLEPYYGELCSTRRDPCDSGPCLNGGECMSSDDNTTFTCHCGQLFDGDNCEIELTTTVPTTVSTSLATGVANSPEKIVSGGSSDEGFLWWHGLIICLIVIIALLVVVVFILARRRKSKEKEGCPTGLPPGNSVMFDGKNLAFENDMYNGRSSNNGVSRLRQPPLPDTPTDDIHFNPTKLGKEEAQGATGLYNPEEDGGYVKPSEPLSKMELELKNQGNAYDEENQRALANQYADLDAVRGAYRGCAGQVEPHYQDLDEVRQGLASFCVDNETKVDMNLIGAQQENPYTEPTMPLNTNEELSPPARKGALPPKPPVRENAYNDVPKNTPAPAKSHISPLGPHTDASPYSPIDDEAEFDFVLADRLSSRRNPGTTGRENLYAEPVNSCVIPPPIPPLPMTPSSEDTPTFANQTYSDVPLVKTFDRSLSNPITEDHLYDDEDDTPKFGLPPVLSIDSAYVSPRGSIDTTLESNTYSEPKASEPFSFHEKNVYDSPRSSFETEKHNGNPMSNHPDLEQYGNLGLPPQINGHATEINGMKEVTTNSLTFQSDQPLQNGVADATALVMESES